jgi:hypothetical protein
MGTGIVSIALLLDGEVTLSRVLMWATACLWAGLTAALVLHALRSRSRLRRQLRLPAALAGVAGTCVLAARFALHDWVGAAEVLLAVAALAWVFLLPGILGSWRRPTVGLSFLLAVSTLALSALASLVATRGATAWLAGAGLLLLAAGLLAYLAVAASFDLGQLLSGRGDQWIAGGALAIGGLAVAQLIDSEGRFHFVALLHGVLSAVGWALWIAAMAWLPFLLVTEALRPRLGFDARRWSTVFPMGMYAAMSFALGRALDSGLLVDFARIWVWPALALWALVALASLRRVVAPPGP